MWISGYDKQGESVATSLSESLEIVVRTDPGVVRDHNEDAVFANPNLGLVILAVVSGAAVIGGVLLLAAAAGWIISRLFRR